MKPHSRNLHEHRLLWALLRDAPFGLVTTRSVSGLLTSRPLINVNAKGDIGDVLCFFVSSEHLWLRDLAVDANVNVAYTPAGAERCLSVSGRGRISGDVARQKRLWTPQWMSQFPQGPSDPTLRLFDVSIEVAQLLDVEAKNMWSLLSPAATPAPAFAASIRAVAPGVYVSANV